MGTGAGAMVIAHRFQLVPAYWLSMNPLLPKEEGMDGLRAVEKLRLAVTEELE